MKIFKYQLPLKAVGSIEIDPKFTLLKLGEQNGVITMWAAVDEDAKREERRYSILGTGQTYPNPTHSYAKGEWEYLDTVFVGPYVWHVFMECE